MHQNNHNGTKGGNVRQIRLQSDINSHSGGLSRYLVTRLFQLRVRIVLDVLIRIQCSPSSRRTLVDSAALNGGDSDPVCSPADDLLWTASYMLFSESLPNLASRLIDLEFSAASRLNISLHTTRAESMRHMARR